MLILFVVFAVSENKNETTEKSTSNTMPVKAKRVYDFAQLSRGAKIFQENCIVCHGQKAEGQKNWRKLNENDRYPAPPLNGTGHAWHHSNEVNANTIRNGTKHLGGNMPAWKDKLSDKDIMDVITWFQSKWPDEVYQVWSENFERPKYTP